MQLRAQADVIIDLQPRDKHVIDHERHVCQHKEHGQHGLSHALKVLHDSRQMEHIEHQAIGRKDRRIDIHELDRPRSRAHAQPADELSQHGIVAEEHEQHGRFLLRRQQRGQSGHGGVPQQTPFPAALAVDRDEHERGQHRAGDGGKRHRSAEEHQRDRQRGKHAAQGHPRRGAALTHGALRRRCPSAGGI